MNLPVEVVEAIQEARCILFVGSRFTAEAAEAQGLPYADEWALAKELGWQRPRIMVGARARPTLPSLLEAAAAYQQQHGRLALETRVRGATGAEAVQPADWHRTALRRFPLVFTTCRDDLLERTARAMGGEPTVRYRDDAVPAASATGRLVYKLNGGFEKHGTVRLTRADRKPLADEAQKEIRRLLRSHVVLFVGYRPDHEEFEQVFEDLTVCYGGELPRCHLAVAQGKIDDVLWQKWVWRGLLMFTADPSECMHEIEARISA